MQKKILVKKSIMSGILVGLGVVVNTLSTNPVVGAMLFSIALLIIIECNLFLFTGRVGYIRLDENVINQLNETLLLNCVGILIPIFCAMPREGFFDAMFLASTYKFSYSAFEMFFFAIPCGALMFLAVHCSKPLITVFCVMVFILSKWEHCIALFPYLSVNYSMSNFLKFLTVVVGNSVGAVFTRKLLN